jgi:hypothetical protein
MSSEPSTYLGSYLRFLIATGRCEPGLEAAIPAIAQWRLATLPRYLVPEDVECVIAACDSATSRGSRNKAVTKKARKTNHIERFNNTLRQRLSRLVRDTFSFSKKVENHIGAIKFFICHYNLEKAAALPV